MEIGRKAVFLICEYNPFHKGHEYQLNILKKHFDTVVCVMSGDFVQRGDCAIADKYSRARTAVLCGADLVVELPYPFSMLSAADFARAGVFIAHAMGANHLAFGLEDELDMVERISKTLENAELSPKGNVSYPRACYAYIHQKLGEQAALAVAKPNNILGFEYLKHCRKYGITPFAVKRNTDFASSSRIRRLLYAGDDAAAHLPQAVEIGNLRSLKSLEIALICALRLWDGGEVYGVRGSEMQAIAAKATQLDSLDALVEACVGKTMTRARIRRTILANFFGIDYHQAAQMPEYTMVLAANQKGCDYLRAHKKSFTIPVLTRPSSIKTQNIRVIDAFMRGNKAEGVLSLCGGDNRNALTKSPYVERGTK